MWVGRGSESQFFRIIFRKLIFHDIGPLNLLVRDEVAICVLNDESLILFLYIFIFL